MRHLEIYLGESLHVQIVFFVKCKETEKLNKDKFKASRITAGSPLYIASY